MKKILVLGVLIIILAETKAQNFVGGGFGNYRFRPTSLRQNDSSTNKKWSLNKYSGISTSFVGWKGGYATIFSAPLALQLNRKISDNVFAFAGVSVSPAYINFHQNFLTTDVSKYSPNSSFMRRTSSFAVYPKAELGLSYTNDEHTFQISGSIGVERSNYLLPVYIPGNNNGNTNRRRFD